MLDRNLARKNLTYRLASILIVLVAIAFVANVTPLLAAPGSASVRAIASSANVAVNSTFTVDVQIDNVSNLYGAEVHLTFSKNLLELVDADTAKPGVQIEPGAMLASGAKFIAVNRADNLAGTIDYAITQLNPMPPVSGNGRLARLTFRTKAKGTASVHFVSSILANRDGGVIPATTSDTQIIIGGAAPTKTSTPTRTPTPTRTATPTRTPTPSPVFAQQGYVFLTNWWTGWCSPHAQRVNIVGYPLLYPHNSVAYLYTEYQTLYPLDRRTAPTVNTRLVRDHEPFSFDVFWPGMRPQDKFVDVRVEVDLLNADRESIMHHPIVIHIFCGQPDDHED